MDISMLPTIPSQPNEDDLVSLVGITFAGPTQYALGTLFARALNGELCSDADVCPRIGDAQIRPEHVMDGMARDYALLPEDLTATTASMGVCSVRTELPSCEGCGGDARYDIWATIAQAPQLLCDTCVSPLDGMLLGSGSATAIMTFDELHWTIRDICDNITAELGRSSLWARASTDRPDVP